MKNVPVVDQTPKDLPKREASMTTLNYNVGMGEFVTVDGFSVIMNH